MQGF
ncbi:uncharacterized protein FFM5_09397 [Fusarium fujikuroi]|jgi:tubulin beta